MQYEGMVVNMLAEDLDKKEILHNGVKEISQVTSQIPIGPKVSQQRNDGTKSNLAGLGPAQGAKLTLNN